jgi:hypothetical protein
MSFQDFRKSHNRLTPRDVGFLLIAGIIIILVLYGLVIGNYYLANLLPDGGEFQLLRSGGRSFLFDRIEPYSGSIPARVQELVYGGPAVSGEDLYILDVPFHLLLLFFPLALIPDPLMARAFWMALSEVALAGFIYFNFRLIERKIPVVFIILLSVTSFTSLYAYRAFLEGSSTILLGFAYAGILLSLNAGLDELAGALMVLSSIQLEIGGPFLFFVALWAFWGRRWQVFAGAGMLAFILFALSFFLYPGWILPFLRAAWNSFRVGYEFSMHEILSNLWPQIGSTLGWIMTAIIIVTLVYEWRAARNNFNRLVWAGCLTFALTPLLGYHFELDQLVPLTLPVMLIVIISRERWLKLGNGIAILLVILYFGAPWVLFTLGVPEGFGFQKEETLFLIWPIFTSLGLYWVRWWMIRPPRTWLDRATGPMR